MTSLASTLLSLLWCVSGGLAAASPSYNILGIFPMPSKSHFGFIDPLMVRLAEKGHRVTSYNPFPKKYKLANYRDVSLAECFRSDDQFVGIEHMLNLTSNTLLNAITLALLDFGTEQFEKCAPLTELLHSTEKYDLLITESFFTDFPSLFAPKFEVPFIAYIPNTLCAWQTDRLANPNNPSYIPNIFTSHMSEMDFMERVVNTLVHIQSVGTYYLYNLRNDEKVFRRALGPSAPSVYDVIKNVSIFFTNAHESFSPLSPSVPTVKNVGGMHIKPAAKLPQDMEKFINESTHGVVYFCMGSLLRGETFPVEKRNAFLSAFKKLPQRVLWKWEGDTLPGKSDNIMIAKWMPQRDILAHPNVKLFISHGGLLGTSEAVYEGVPILGIPVFGDQRTNLKNIEANGAGEVLEYFDISAEVVYEKASRLLNDPSYKKNAADLSSRYRDRPMSALDTAVYWTEYVIRHKGAHHLKTAAVHMPWYQYLLLDVIAFLASIVIFAFTILYYILRTICRCFRPAKKVKVKKN